MRASAVGLIAVALLAGCDHSEPFPPPQPADAPPRGAGNPIRVTYNLGTDLRPTWLPDGSGFFYTQERTDRADEDRCFARMPSGGGSILEEICDRSSTTDDSIATFEWAAVDTQDRLAYLRAGTPLSPPTLATRTLELRLGTRVDPTGVSLRSFPYAAPSGAQHWSFSFLQWLNASRLVYLAENVQYVPPCNGCAPDTLRTGIELVTIDPATGAIAIVPGTTGATGVAVAGGDTVLYSLDTSTAIRGWVQSSGAVSVVHTFASPPRDVAAGGGLVAAIGGVGELWFVYPGIAAGEVSAPQIEFKRPAVSPSGTSIVVEGYAVRMDTVRVNGTIVAINRIVSTSADLWVFNLP